MATIQLHLAGHGEEKMTLTNTYNGIYEITKVGVKDEKPYFAITLNTLGIFFYFESAEDFSNFVKQLKSDFLQVGEESSLPVKAIVEVYRNDEQVRSGEYSYVEFLSHGDKPSFFISVHEKTHNSFEIELKFDIKDELQKMLNKLEQAVEECL